MKKLLYALAVLVLVRLEAAEQRVTHSETAESIEEFQEKITLSGHEESVNSVSWSFDGLLLASGSNDYTIRIWDPHLTTSLKTLRGHKYFINSVDWSQNSLVASGSGTYHMGTVKVWDPRSSKCLQTLVGHERSVKSISWSPDSSQLASGSDDKTVKVWDLRSSKCLQTLVGHENWLSSVSWSPDGSQLASGSGDSTIKIWDPRSSKCLQTLVGHRANVSSVNWSPDSFQLVSGSDDKTVKVWDTHSATYLQMLPDHSESVWSVSWSPDNSFLASGSLDDTIKIWDLQKNRHLQLLTSPNNSAFSVSWSPDSSFLAAGFFDKTIKIWEGKKAEKSYMTPPSAPPAEPEHNADLPREDDGEYKASKEVSPEEFQETTRLEGHTDRVSSVSWSPDGLLASGSKDGTVKLWDPKTSSCNHTLKGHGGWWSDNFVNAVSWSQDGSQIGSGSADKTVKVWESRTGTCLNTLKGHSDHVTSVDWSRDGILASGSSDKTVRIWDPRAARCLQTLEGHSGGVNSVSWSLDNLLAVGSYKSTSLLRDKLISGSLTSDFNPIKIWDPRSAQCLYSLDDYNVLEVCWSPDGKFLASGSFEDKVKIWDPRLGRCMHLLKGHPSAIASVNWSSDGRRLASADQGGYIRIWDPHTAECICRLKKANCTTLSWSPDNAQLVSGCWDGLISIFEKVEESQPSTQLEPSEITPASAPPGELENLSEVEELRGALKESQREAEQRKLDEDGGTVPTFIPAAALPNPFDVTPASAPQGESGDDRQEGEPAPDPETVTMLTAALHQLENPALNFFRYIATQKLEAPIMVAGSETYFSEAVHGQLDTMLEATQEEVQLFSFKQLVQQERDKFSLASIDWKAWNEIMNKVTVALVSRLS